MSPTLKEKEGRKQGAPRAAAAAPADPALANAEVHTLKVQGNVYMIVGPGATPRCRSGDSGALVVDTQYAAVSDKIMAEIRKLTDKPIRYIINTRRIRIDTGGNARISKAGAPVIGGNLGAVAFEGASHHRGARERAAPDEQGRRG